MSYLCIYYALYKPPTNYFSPNKGFDLYQVIWISMKTIVLMISNDNRINSK